MIIEINNRHPQPRRIKQVVEQLRAGEVIAYPTDTVYGIGCDIFNKNAIEKVYRIKKRDRHKPLSFICKDLSDASRFAKLSDESFRLLRRLLPGPYTFILEATHLVPKIMLTRRRTVGIRIPDSPIAIALVEELGNPIITTSANLSAEEVLTDPREIHAKMGHQLAMVIDGDILPVQPSSVVDLTGDEPVILRRGQGDVSFFET